MQYYEVHKTILNTFFTLRLSTTSFTELNKEKKTVWHLCCASRMIWTNSEKHDNPFHFIVFLFCLSLE